MEIDLGDSLLERVQPLECSVCLDRMKEICFLVTEPDPHDGSVCGHHFCKKCIEPIIEKARSVNRSARCPTCRRKILGFSRSKIADELLTEVGTLKEEKRELELEKETLQKTIGQLKQEKGENEWKRKYEELKKSSETAHKEIEKKTPKRKT